MRRKPFKHVGHLEFIKTSVVIEEVPTGVVFVVCLFETRINTVMVSTPKDHYFYDRTVGEVISSLFSSTQFVRRNADRTWPVNRVGL